MCKTLYWVNLPRALHDSLRRGWEQERDDDDDDEDDDDDDDADDDDEEDDEDSSEDCEIQRGGLPPFLG